MRVTVKMYQNNLNPILFVKDFVSKKGQKLFLENELKIFGAIK